MIRYIIDGHNVIHKIPEYADLLDRDYVRCLKTIHRELLEYSRSKEIQAVLVFDGNPPSDPPERSHGVTVVFSGESKDADSIIIHWAEKWSGRQTVVVTEDRSILRAVSSVGCLTMRAADFHRLLKRKKRKNKRKRPSGKQDGLTPSEVAWWKGEMAKAMEKKKAGES